MAIFVHEDEKIFTLQTRNSTYQMKVERENILMHTYYGKKTDNSDKSKLFYFADRGFSGNPYEIGMKDRTFSLDTLPQEYSGFDTGDHRITSLKVQSPDGSTGVQLRYKGHRIENGKYAIPGMPAVYADKGETFVVCLEDRCVGIEVELYYGVLEELDVITRTVKITNCSADAVILQKVGSMNLDLQCGKHEWVRFCGRYAMERIFRRTPIHHGVQIIGSNRGASSHQYNPFTIFCEEGSNETMGECYGISFAYSGEFSMEIEKDHIDQTRVICGINPESFNWTLNANEEFWAPEVIMAYSQEGFGKLSRIFHKTIREHICRGEWKNKRRPILINNWEATYFDFTGDKLVDIAKEAAKLGVELFVMDDGWFGKRENDKSGLGDWVPNEEKLQCTLKELGERIVAEGMQFGIWFEPEGVSEDSDLYRAHPEWAIQVPGRKPCLSRSQLILDFSNKEVQDHLICSISKVLSSAPITYVKWDFNRSICDKYSSWLGKERQGEFTHRYVLGLYRVLEELTSRFPHVLFEGCSGGGGRFDAGMLYYTPQIWCSDNTDAIERLEIQYGTSFGYPVSVVGSHVSAVPNHQTGRITPLSTRGCVAMAGTFGYELDINKMTLEEKEDVKEQIQRFKRHYELIQRGDYYRLTTPYSEMCTVWETASEDGTQALVSAVYHRVQANPVPNRVKIYGLRREGQYQLCLEGKADAVNERKMPYGFAQGEYISGAALEDFGIVIPEAQNGYQAYQIYVREVTA